MILTIILVIAACGLLINVCLVFSRFWKVRNIRPLSASEVEELAELRQLYKEQMLAARTYISIGRMFGSEFFVDEANKTLKKIRKLENRQALAKLEKAG